MEQQNFYAKHRLLAERKGGAMLAGTDGHGSHGGNRKSSLIVKLEEAGITKNESHRWQAIARIPEPVFTKHLRPHGTPISRVSG
jgi:hypothetical protein